MVGGHELEDRRPPAACRGRVVEGVVARGVLDEAGLTSRVDFAVTSARAGVRKPHPLIFRRALDLAGVGPAEAMFVGDSWEADVGGARSAGIGASRKACS